METTQTIYNQARYDQEVKYIKGRNYALQLHKLYNIDDLALITMIQQDNKFKKFIRKLNKKYYNIAKDDLKGIIEDILFDIVRNRESIVVNYDQMISYTIKSIENRCKNYIRDQKTLKNGYDKEGNNLVSSFEAHRNDLGELPFIDKTSTEKYEEVEVMLSMQQIIQGSTNINEVQKTISWKYLQLKIFNDMTDEECAEVLGVSRKTLQNHKKKLQEAYTFLNK